MYRHTRHRRPLQQSLGFHSEHKTPWQRNEQRPRSRLQQGKNDTQGRHHGRHQRLSVLGFGLVSGLPRQATRYQATHENVALPPTTKPHRTPHRSQHLRHDECTARSTRRHRICATMRPSTDTDQGPPPQPPCASFLLAAEPVAPTSCRIKPLAGIHRV